LRHEPHPSPVRQVPPLFNIYEDRSEGFATAMEELVMQAGLYDDIPHGRELGWIMLANRAARGRRSAPPSRLVGFDRRLSLRQPGYGPSYIVGKMELDHLLAVASHRAEIEHSAVVFRDAVAATLAPRKVP